LGCCRPAGRWLAPAEIAREYGRSLHGTGLHPLAVDRLAEVLTDLYAGQPGAE